MHMRACISDVSRRIKAYLELPNADEESEMGI